MYQSLFTEASSWIWLPGSTVSNSYGEFRSVFRSNNEAPVRMHISAEGAYVAWINGNIIPSSQFPDFPHYKAVQTPEISDYINDGENELLVQVWYPGRDTQVSRKEIPGVRFEVWQDGEILCASSKQCQARAIAGYETEAVPDVTVQMGSGFCFRHISPFAWQKAVEVEKPVQLVLRPICELNVETCSKSTLQTQGFFQVNGGSDPGEIQQMAGLFYLDLQKASTEPSKYLPNAAGLQLKTDQGDGLFLLLDLGETTSGYLAIDVVTPEQSRIDIGFGEHLEDLRVRTSVGGRCFAVSTEVGPARKRFVHRFRRLGGRYLQLFVHSREATIYEAGLLTVSYPVSEVPTFHCGDHLHNKIYEISRKTLHACMHDHYEDCPWREQALYGFDSRNQMLAGYYAFGEFTFARENLRMLALSQREDGLLELCAPARAVVNIPTFTLSFLIALEEYCRYSGDLNFGAEMLPVAERILQRFLTHVQDGLVHNYQGIGMWNFYEWSEGLDGMPMGEAISPEPSIDAGLQLFGILALQRMETLCTWLNQEASIWKKNRIALQKGLEAFWNEEKGAYAAYLRNGKLSQYSELIQDLALYTNSCPSARSNELRARLLNNDWIPTTLSFSVFRYEALLQEPERYAEAVFNEIAERWGKMLYRNATTFWETDKGEADFDGAGSLCHGWSGIPIYFYGAYVLGIRPEKPGIWRPQSVIRCGISSASGTMLTPEGKLDAGSPPVCTKQFWFCLQNSEDKIYF